MDDAKKDVSTNSGSSDADSEPPSHDILSAIQALECEYETPVPGQQIYIVRGLAARFGLDARGVYEQMYNNYPHRKRGDKIEWGKVQWVDGDNEALHYRGKPIPRNKVWAQLGDPAEVGFRRYTYTGWQYAVLPATSNVDDVPELAPFFGRFNDWLVENKERHMNHLIVTAYDKEDCGIGMHSVRVVALTQRRCVT